MKSNFSKFIKHFLAVITRFYISIYMQKTFSAYFSLSASISLFSGVGGVSGGWGVGGVIYPGIFVMFTKHS